jgi:hypothetical protein
VLVVAPTVIAETIANVPKILAVAKIAIAKKIAIVAKMVENVTATNNQVGRF